MTYAVKEIFLTLQGEGAQAGRVAVFCRFAGCNLWSGHERDRARATCRFCDTDFVGTDGTGGGRFDTATDLRDAIRSHWPGQAIGKPLVVLTGGEPSLQLDQALIETLHADGFELAVETNGTRPLPQGIDWITVSPKAGTDLVVKRGGELKLVFPQPDAPPVDFESLDFDNFFLQPMDGARKADNTRAAIDYCLQHPRWRLSIQAHKYLGIA